MQNGDAENVRPPQGTVAESCSLPCRLASLRSEVRQRILRCCAMRSSGAASGSPMNTFSISWVQRTSFLDRTTEMVIHVGQALAGWRGMIAGGVRFILPAALIVLVCA